VKYPCETCLVDAICNEVCDSLVFFSDDLISPIIPSYLVKTHNRADRLIKCILRYGRQTRRGDRLTNNIERARRLFKEKQNEESM
jgi:hypothetical protein